jgi:prepilin-type N-terminal cleavage/methylation domain-containing protein
MSIQKRLSKGFTLIELMVVIVIIGILAAVAIPKLFGMSAKAKAQEVGPAAGTWSKLQMAYKMETGEFGGAKSISYKVPGANTADASDGSTSNFSYTVAATGTNVADFTATSKFTSDPCQSGTWTAKFANEKYDVPEMSITGTPDAQGCFSLTPNYIRIGCSNNKTLDPNAVDCAK